MCYQATFISGEGGYMQVSAWCKMTLLLKQGLF